VITTVSAIMQRLCPVEYIKKHSFAIKKGDKRDIAKMREELTSYGYLSCQQVLSHGEFAVRGSILDIYPMGSITPYRIDFFDDEVDSVRTFDIDTQRSLDNIEGISILPAHECPLDQDAISIFRSNYRDAFPGVNLSAHVIYQAVSKGAIPSGIEYYLPLFFAKMATFFDYLPENSCIVTVDDVEKESSEFEIDVRKRALDFTGNSDHPPLEPNKVFLTAHELLENLKKHYSYRLQKAAFEDEKLKDRGYYNFETDVIPEIAFEHNNKDSMSGFIAFANTFIDKGGRILLSALSEGRRQSLREILPASLTNKYGIKAASSIDDFYNSDSKLMLTISPFDEGVILPEKKIAFLTESELFGFKVVRSKSSSRRSKVNVDSIITSLATLKEGQVVVHIDHGIGRYRGLKTMVIGGVKGEYLTIEYQNGDMLNIPITSLNRISRYSGSDNPPLSKLGNDTWNKKKQKAADKVTDVAAKLLDLYARREAVKGTSFEVSEYDLSSFASGFGYQETPDQADAIEKTLADLKKDTPMDRLVCGDVGFGKTEIALRAAFVVASCGSQVAMLVPTTILAEQHYQNFKERFAGTALNVELLSRFKTVKEQNEVIKRMESGSVDIVIGTHKLLNRELKFKKLGLLIIDEEHRFGVKQKEKLKELRAQVDLLTLTATPIPRTLNMAMEGMRELSIIATPPEHRLAVKTFVQQQSDTTTREAVMRELRRGGQVYYLHNDVSTIEQKAQKLSELIPEAKIGIGHGQLNERELQKVMRDFYHQRFNLLVCSTIIENGLDVSNANTIIIDRADLLGLAQLHQIRGRVGRSHHQAYAYFFTPPKELISKDAKLRLDAIASLEELGAGFVLATHDLEIRGAGELLGEEQSGQIESVGFSLYSQMLEAAVKALKEGHEPSLAELNLSECEIDLNIPCLFPDDYIADVSTRLSL
ncbi:MAG: transcription-repair coupling factor, partial [Succinivibrio sp.]